MKWILIGLLVILVAIGGWVGFYVYGAYENINREVSNSENVQVIVEEDDDWEKLVVKMKEAGVINSDQGLLLYSKFKELKPTAGSYEVLPKTLIKNVLGMMSKGVPDFREEIEVMIKEGTNIQELADILAEKFSFTAEEFVQATKDYDTEGLSYVDAKNNLEGYLYPDTYRFYEDSKPSEIIAKMLNNFENKAVPILRDKKSDLNWYQTLILASIVEKEVPKSKDRAIVAGIFLNRYKIGMALQSDATVNYLTNSGRDRSTFTDLEIDSPYNTYKYAGLPPAPITSPSVNAIVSVLEPEKSDYLFFLTGAGGNVVYAKDFQQHIKNRQIYLK
jgi:UPF0755 protein